MRTVGAVAVALATHSHPDRGPYHQLLLWFSLQNTDELLCSRSLTSWWEWAGHCWGAGEQKEWEEVSPNTAPNCQLLIYWRESGSSGSGQEELSPLLPVSCWPQPKPLDETQKANIWGSWRVNSKWWAVEEVGGYIHHHYCPQVASQAGLLEVDRRMFTELLKTTRHWPSWGNRARKIEWWVWGFYCSLWAIEEPQASEIQL